MSQVRDATVILPGQMVGILGGGQLGRMIALEGRKMGYRFVTLDPTPNSPCGQVCDEQIVAPYSDVEAARRVAELSDVITYEFENVDVEVAALLERSSHVPQGSRLLNTTKHRVREKRAVRSAGVPVADFATASSLDELHQAVHQVGLPCVMKTTTGGYDGKGQWLLKTMDNVESAWNEFDAHRDALLSISTGSEDDAPLIVEAFVPFVKELSVIVARNPRGQVACFPVSENIHRDHILHLSIVPARVDDSIQQRAQQMGEQIATALDVVGLVAVELFLTMDGQLCVNELAPRPHNSGHYTYDACVTSQFEQHLRAVCNLPLGDPRLLSPVVMVNILGQHVAPVLDRLPNLPANMKLHLYGKQQAKHGRKMGHLNVVADSVEEAMEQIDALDIWESTEIAPDKA